MRTTLTFHFNEEKVKASGTTTGQLLEDMRAYAEECGVTETTYGVFEKEGAEAMAVLVGYAVRKAKEDWGFYELLDSLIADVDGAKEDCKEEMRTLLQETERK